MAVLASSLWVAAPVGAGTVVPARATVYPATLCNSNEGRWHLQWIVSSEDSDPVSITASVDGQPVAFSPNPVAPGGAAHSGWWDHVAPLLAGE